MMLVSADIPHGIFRRTFQLFTLNQRMSTDDRDDDAPEELRGTSREQLLDAAARVFAERGYRGASVEAIAAQAGVTKGALYWNFESKADLFFSLLDERVDQRLRLLVERTQALAGRDTVPPLVSREVSSVVDEERQIHLLTNEYWALAVRDPELGARFAERQRSLRELIAGALLAHHEATSVTLAYDPHELATAVLALAHGLAMDRLIEADAVPDSLFGDILALIYDGLVLRSASAALKPGNASAVD
jgi:AcrR family transcriptional regulator